MYVVSEECSAGCGNPESTFCAFMGLIYGSSESAARAGAGAVGCCAA